MLSIHFDIVGLIGVLSLSLPDFYLTQQEDSKDIRPS